MANRVIHNCKLVAVTAVVPPTVFSINDYLIMQEAERKQFIEKVGIEKKRHVSPGMTSGDLCEAAANKLLDGQKINRNEIDALIFVSQTRDHIFPCTSVILQHKLNLSKSCLAFDVPLGCSGYVYGITILAALMESGTIRKALLLCGDACSTTVSYKDKTFFPLLGDAGTASFFEYDQKASPIYSSLHSDGSEYKNLIMQGGGFREPWDEDVITEKTRWDGIPRKGYQGYMNGMKIFEFSLREVAKNIKEVIAFAGCSPEAIDYFILHQANLLINESIRKQLKMGKSKFPISLATNGNTGAASIPLTMVSEMGHILKGKKNKLLLSGFGVGLSWGSLCIETNDIFLLPVTDFK
ncbi:MAG: ketoacyl-ACP synthase [Bacteroidota bacterium]|nr:ketoacyl-ACP synthase [Bacteroidota bacterium]